MTDWAAWPIFSLQCLAFLLFFFKRSTQCFGMRIKTIAMILMLISCVLIAVSLYHDSTEVLNLHF